MELILSQRTLDVIFIGGFGHTGSTLLDRLLGQVDGVFSGGELARIWPVFGANRPCGCGRPFRSCPFWTGVLETAFGEMTEAEIGELERLYHRLARPRNIPRMLIGLPPANRELFDRCAVVLERLYKAIASASGCDVVVDSSKRPAHGLLLAKAGSFRVHVVHLIRDSRAIAYSLQRKENSIDAVVPNRDSSAGSLKFAFGWTSVNLAVAMSKRSAYSYQRLRYEDFAGDPRATLETILEFTGFTAPKNLDFLSANGAVLDTAHTVSGNRRVSPLTGNIRIKPDEEWVAALPKQTKRLLTILTYPLLRRYGYGL